MCASASVVKEKVILTLVNGRGFIFSADDYLRLRREERILGSLVGNCCARMLASNMNVLPVKLSPYETQLLVERGLAVLVSKRKSLIDAPLPLAMSTVTLRQDMLEQANLQRAEKCRRAQQNMTKILMGKRKKLLAAGVPADEIRLDPDEILKEIGESAVFVEKNTLLEIPSAHHIGHVAEIVKVPPDTSLKYRVFRDLWQRGHYISPGETFGVDFLVYPGDPMLYHASHVVVLLDEPKVNAAFIVAKSRMAVYVKKRCVFAYLTRSKRNHCADAELEDDQESQIHYLTFTWRRDEELMEAEQGTNNESETHK